MAKTVAILGAGASGLTAIKCCLDEGQEPVCFERSGYLGGVWHFTKDDVPDSARMMLDTVAMNSKAMMSFSDFPAPLDFPVYMHNTHVDRYLNLYADRFALRKHVLLKHEVLSVTEAADHVNTGRWTVAVRDIDDGTTETRTFDGVLVCTGFFRKPYSPNIEGLGDFKGTTLHANRYKDSTNFKGQKVLVVGFGNSSADIATDLCNSAEQVYLSARHGGWVVERASSERGLSRFVATLAPYFPKLMNSIMAFWLNRSLDHQRYKLSPKDEPLKANVAVSDNLQTHLTSGAVLMKPAITRFRDSTVEFVDGSEVMNVDAVVLATGYNIVHPFLDSSVIGDDKTRLYKAMYPPDRQHHTLAFLNCFRLRGPVFPIVELQARVATRVLKGSVHLPSKKEMLRDIWQRNANMAENKHPRMLDVIQVDYFPYMDELANMIGCKPDMWRLVLTDWHLAMKCLFGPVTSYQFRLQGPNIWDGARKAILMTEDPTSHLSN